MRALRRGYVPLGAAAAAAILVLADLAPLTYDEAFNRNYYASFPISQIVRSYDLPNNHIPFTILQHFVGLSLIRWNPWAVRLFGVLFGIAMVATLLAIAARRRVTPWLPVAAVAGSPLLVEYLFVARGYTFSGLFLALGCIAPAVLRDRSPTAGLVLGATAFALGTWPLPDKLYAAPGWALGLVALYGARRAVVAVGVYAAEVAAALAPIAGQIHKQAKAAWAGHHAWWVWFGPVVRASNLVWFLLLLAALLTLAARLRAVGGAWSLGRLRASSPATQLALLATSSAVSWFVLIALTYAAGLETLPFVRSAVPVLWLAVVALVAAVPRGRVELVVVALLLPGLAWSLVVWSRAAGSGDWALVDDHSGNPVLASSLPTSVRDVPKTGADRVACGYFVQPACELVARNLARRGVRVTFPEALPARDAAPCVLGTRRVPPTAYALVYRGSKLLGVLCD